MALKEIKLGPKDEVKKKERFRFPPQPPTSPIRNNLSKVIGLKTYKYLEKPFLQICLPKIKKGNQY